MHFEPITPSNSGPLNSDEVLPGDYITFHTHRKGDRTGVVIHATLYRALINCTDNTTSRITPHGTVDRRIRLITTPNPTPALSPSHATKILTEHPNLRPIENLLERARICLGRGLRTKALERIHQAACLALGAFHQDGPHQREAIHTYLTHYAVTRMGPPLHTQHVEEHVIPFIGSLTHTP